MVRTVLESEASEAGELVAISCNFEQTAKCLTLSMQDPIGNAFLKCALKVMKRLVQAKMSRLYAEPGKVYRV